MSSSNATPHFGGVSYSSTPLPDVKCVLFFMGCITNYHNLVVSNNNIHVTFCVSQESRGVLLWFLRWDLTKGQARHWYKLSFHLNSWLKKDLLPCLGAGWQHSSHVATGFMRDSCLIPSLYVGLCSNVSSLKRLPETTHFKQCFLF